MGLANGEVVVVADSLDEMAKRLRQLEPDSLRTFWIEVGVDYEAVDEIWGIP